MVGPLRGILGSGADIQRLVSVGYPVLDVLLLAALLRVLFVRGDRTWSYAAVTASVALLLLSDSWYVIPALTDRYVEGTWRDAGWLLSYVLIGAAALHPSMRTFVTPRPGRTPLRRVILLGLSVFGVAIAAIVQQALEGHVHVYSLAGAAAGAALFVVYRVAGLIRELERATAAAEDSEQRFRLVFERSPIGISVGSDGIMSETNPALQRMLGYSGEELARMHYTDVTHPDDRSLAVQHELDDAQRDAFAIDKRYVRKDGSALDAHVHVALDVDHGVGVSLIEDVTDRQRARGAAAPGAEDGGDRPARRRHRARLQQPADGGDRLQRPAAARSSTGDAAPREGEPRSATRRCARAT